MNRAHLIPLFLVGLWLVPASVAGLSVGVDNLIQKRTIITCLKNYSPCNCTDDNLVCDQVPVKTIHSIFNAMTWHDLNSVKIIISPNETEQIPDDVLGTARVTNSVNLTCTENSYLRVAENAFRETAKFITNVTIDGCNLEKLKYSFMRDMRNLHSMHIFRSFNFKTFYGLPDHDRFKLISITDSRHFLALDDYSYAPFRLEKLYLNDNMLDDTEAAKLMISLTSSSVEFMTEIRLHNNVLTRIPDRLLYITNLQKLSLENNYITLLSAKSLAFNGPISINLDNNKIKTIRPGAFGSLKNMGTFVSIQLNRNKFNRLDSSAFQTVLEGMALAGEGSLELGENPIKCDCSLAWLLRDSRHLLSHVSFGMCDDSTDFPSVTLDRFSLCPTA